MDNKIVSYELQKGKIHGIHQYDGYKSEPIWLMDEQVSGYNNYRAAKQCIVPLKSLEELRVEFGLDADN